jgi:ATP-dependent DNA helicase DinG
VPAPLKQARAAATLPDRWAAHAWPGRTWAQGTAAATSPRWTAWTSAEVIPLVTSTRDNCLGSECADTKPAMWCARREAMAADVVVVNHHLFFADLALRDSGVAELLPSVDMAVFDEAHQLPEAGVQFLGRRWAPRRRWTFARTCWPRPAAGARAGALAGLAAAWSRRRATCAWPPPGRCAIWVRHAQAALGRARAREDFAAALAELGRAADAAGEALDTVSELRPISQLAERAGTPRWPLRGRAATGRVRWIDVSAHQARLIESPLDIRERCRAEGGRPQGLGLHLGHAGRRRSSELVQRAAGLDDARSCAWAAPSTMPRMRGSMCRRLSQAQRGGAPGRGAGWPRAARARWAGAPSC